ncbi:hypothetical protein QA584_13020 [Anaerocolumna sp. AGMB13025]|uniref:hypothetical protein n=1 Tax=Anaerocolumna sp. AGMB13025 TaxID=3039116 RepID=UPI00241DEAC2|nr:hypothetical protein [Anaerocolumna sp. AGMB13025]WFR60283.1 hypothetical protein QA584_13020 [Anaerocolumna sp. AGMB13025]
MALNLKVSSVGTRENRLGSITGYNGDLQDLVNQSRCGTLKNRERCFSQSTSRTFTFQDIRVLRYGPLSRESLLYMWRMNI